MVMSFGSSLLCFGLLCFGTPQGVAFECDAVSIVNEAIEDGVGVGRISDQGVPFWYRNLASNESSVNNALLDKHRCSGARVTK
jgi:hypothetical protein